MKGLRLISFLLAVAMLGPVGASAGAEGNNYWGQASTVFAQMGQMSMTTLIEPPMIAVMEPVDNGEKVVLGSARS